MSTQTLEQKFEMLPSELQKEAADFIDFLLTRKSSKQKKKPKLNWIGGLKEYRSQYTSLELQEKALELPLLTSHNKPPSHIQHFEHPLEMRVERDDLPYILLLHHCHGSCISETDPLIKEPEKQIPRRLQDNPININHLNAR